MCREVKFIANFADKKTKMKRMEKYRGKLVEWLVLALSFFFLYDIIWAIADFEHFKQSFEGYWFSLFLDFAYCGLFSLVSLSVNHILLRQKFFKLAETNRRIFIRSAIFIVAVNIFIAGVCDFMLDVIAPDFMEDDVWGTFFLFGIIASLLTLIHLLLHYSDIMIRRSNENIRLQKKYLKLQLDPHFVFNSLSSLAGMIGDEPQKAEEYVVRLSQVYRYTLRNIEQDYTTLHEAMDFAETYVDLLNLRYDNKVILETDAEQGKGNDKILAQSLQLLIENAVKHNTPQENTPLHIQIRVQDGMLAIRNNRIYAHGHNDQVIESYGLGLKNLKQRYELECGKSIGYSVADDYFEICLPVIKETAIER